MKTLLLILAAALGALACGDETTNVFASPTDPTTGPLPMSAKFECLENAATTTLTCTDSTTGGVRPYVYLWFSTFQPQRIAPSQNRVVWNYAQQCADHGGAIVVTVRLVVQDSSLPDRQEDTDELGFTVCELA